MESNPLLMPVLRPNKPTIEDTVFPNVPLNLFPEPREPLNLPVQSMLFPEANLHQEPERLMVCWLKIF